MWIVIASYMFLLGMFMLTLYNVKIDCQTRFQSLNTIYKTAIQENESQNPYITSASNAVDLY